MTADAGDLTADDLEQLATSLAVDGTLGRPDTMRVVEVLRAVAPGTDGPIHLVDGGERSLSAHEVVFPEE